MLHSSWRAAGAFVLANAALAALPAFSAGAVGTAQTHFSGTQSIRTTATSTGFDLIDPDGDHARVCFSDQAQLDIRCSSAQLMTGTTNVWGNSVSGDPETVAADAMFGVQKTTEMLNGLFNRPRIFTDRTKYADDALQVIVHGVPNRIDSRGAVYEPDVPAGGALSAGGSLHFYLGFPTTGEKSATALDIVAHETGHALAQTVGFGKTDPLETRGINEGSSDIIGALTEWWAGQTTTTPDTFDWTFGEGINYRGTGKPIRYMYKPSLGGGLDCWTSNIGTADAHQSAGLLGKFFYMLSQGSADPDGSGPIPTAPTCGASAVTGVSITTAARIWYRTLTTYVNQINPGIRYAASGDNDLRAATLKAATDLHGLCSLQYRAVQAAWNATAVPGEDTRCPTTYSSTTTAPIPAGGAAETSVVSNQPGYAPSYITVTPNITYPVSGALTIDLIAPNGTSRRVLSPTTKTTAYQNVSYTVPWGGSTPTQGTWKLRVSTSSGSTGQLSGWTLNLG